MNDIYEIAIHAAKSGAKRGCYAICFQDLEDMIQEAALAIWQSKNKYNKGRAYYFVAGRRWAEAWLKWWKYGANTDKLRGMYDDIDPPISLFDLHRYETITPIFGNTKWLVEMSDEQTDLLKMVFYKTRKKFGKKEIEAIDRDVMICQGLYARDSTEAIGLSIGKSPHMVNRYRADIRNRLRKYIKKTNYDSGDSATSFYVPR